MTYYFRRSWKARPPRTRSAMAADDVRGIAFHWPAMTKPIRGVEAVKAALRGWQDYHMDNNGWSDIAYQEAFDQDGNVYRLRGVKTRSAANGSTDVNRAYGAFLLILAPGEKPSPAMVASVRRRVARHRVLFPRSKQLVGHGEIRPSGPTECPGPAVRTCLDTGVFEPVQPGTAKSTHVSDARDSLEKAAVNRPRLRERIADFLERMPKR